LTGEADDLTGEADEDGRCRNPIKQRMREAGETGKGSGGGGNMK